MCLQWLDNHSSYPNKSYSFRKLLLIATDAINLSILLAIASQSNPCHQKAAEKTANRQIKIEEHFAIPLNSYAKQCTDIEYGMLPFHCLRVVSLNASLRLGSKDTFEKVIAEFIA